MDDDTADTRGLLRELIVSIYYYNYNNICGSIWYLLYTIILIISLNF